MKKYKEIKNKITIIKNDKNLLIKENQELKNEINKNEDINSLKNELAYKNSIIKYLEEILYNSKNNNKEIEDSLRDDYEKNKKKFKKNLEKNKNKNKVNKINKKKLKLNEHLIIKNEESNEVLKDDEINLEINNNN